MNDQNRFTTAIGLSLLLHALFLTLLPFIRRVDWHPAPAPPSVEVDLLPAPPRPPAPPPRPAPVAPPAESAPAPPPPANILPKQQIVAPPDAGEEKEPPPNTRLLSDRNNVVAEERVHKGEGGAAGAPAAPNAPREARPPSHAGEPKRSARTEPEPQQMAKAKVPSLDALLPSAGDIIRQGVPVEPEAKHAAPTGNDFLASGNRLAYNGRPGTMDFLPTIREGDITLLNTKANLFAPFVRRVAARVFEHIEMTFRRSLQSGHLRSGHETAVVDAVMDKSGHLVGAQLVDHSGTSGLEVDRALINAAQPDTFFDANPPPGAEAADGLIHFVLQIEMTVESGVDKQGVPRSGYYGVAGVGLK